MSTAKELKKEIERGVWDASLGKLYGRRAGVLERQRARYADALDCFAALYGGEREAAIYSAPGRTEIGGNHTDHNHGVVMAGAVDLDVIAVVSKNTDDVVRVKSKGFDGRDEVKLEQLSPVPAEQGRSAALIRKAGRCTGRLRRLYHVRCAARLRAVQFGCVRGCHWYCIQWGIQPRPFLRGRHRKDQSICGK